MRAEYPSAVLVDMQPILLSARITPRTVDNSVHLLHLQWLDRWRCTSSRHIIQRGRIVTNNLTMNRNKPKEIVFSDPRRRRQIESPPPATDIARVTSVKILGVTMTNGLSASDHVRDVIRSCAQTLYALRVLRTHGMSRGAAGHLPVNRHRQVALCIQCLDWVHQSN